MVPAATVRLVPARKMGLDGGGGEHASGGGEGVSEGPDYENSSVWDLKEPFAGIGRVATMRAFRGRGYGRVLVEEALRWAGGHGGDVGRGLRGEGEGWKGLLLIHAQVVVEGWYRGLGWRTDEGMGRWDEVGIMHVGMWKRVEVLGG